MVNLRQYTSLVFILLIVKQLITVGQLSTQYTMTTAAAFVVILHVFLINWVPPFCPLICLKIKESKKKQPLHAPLAFFLGHLNILHILQMALEASVSPLDVGI